MSDPNQPIPPYDQNPYQPPTPPPTYGQPYPQPPYGQPQYGQPPYGQPQYGQPYYGQPPYGAPAPNPEAYAHWGRRFAARLLDGLILLPGYVVGVVGVVIASSASDGAGPDAVVIAGVAVAVVGYVGIIGFNIWNTFVREGRTGQSFGKQWMGIKLISEETGQPIGGWPAFGRGLLHVVDGLACYIGYLWPLWDAKRQTFADKIMSTIVVPAPRSS